MYQINLLTGDRCQTLAILLLSKEEGKDQESIQSSTTPDLIHHMGK